MTMIWTAGAHSPKFGFKATKLIENTWAHFQVAPQWTFSNLASFMQGNAATLNGQVSDAQNPGLIQPRTTGTGFLQCTWTINGSSRES
jgi:hypothetical protein